MESSQQETVMIAGATGYAGRCLVEEFASRPNFRVKALVRRQPTPPFPSNVEIVLAEATRPKSLEGVMEGVDMIVSALGITRQRDGLTYQDVDYQANMNLLQQALLSETVKRFGYIHVIQGEELANHSIAIAAKQAFVDDLIRLTKPLQIQPVVMCPSGFFSDMQDFLDMAKSRGGVYLFGDGHYRLNPIHGADLAKATADAMEQADASITEGQQQLDDDSAYLHPVGGPDIFTHRELATLALEVMGKPGGDKNITYLWDGWRRMLVQCLPWTTPRSVYGPAQFFLQAFAMDMIGECTGTHHLKDYWQELVTKEKK